MAWDQATMFSMLEMPRHRAKFISDVLYVYEAANLINDSKVNRQLQRNLEMEIRAQKRYDRLKKVVKYERVKFRAACRGTPGLGSERRIPRARGVLWECFGGALRSADEKNRERSGRGARSHPPEEVGGRDGPLAPVVLDVVAKAGGVPMGDVIPADYVHGRSVHPSKPGHLDNYPAGPGRAIEHSLPGRHPTLRERLHPGRKGPQPAQECRLRVPPP
jgi:hypothetical protein